MAGRVSSKRTRCIHLSAWLLLGLGAGLSASCTAGNNLSAKTQVPPVPAGLGTSITGNNATVADVTEYYTRSGNNVLQPGRGLAIFTTENFVGSARCAVCHELLTDRKGDDMSIAGHWRSTMMANGAKDPLWQAKVSSESKRNPAIKEIIEKKCATCHTPMAWTQAYKDGQEQLLLGAGFLNPGNPLHSAAMDGVSCSLCHQIRNENLDQKKGYSGKYVVDTGVKAPERVIYGPYTNPVQEVMQVGVGYTPEYSSHINHSALCATCHTLYTPYVDAQGKVAGEFPEQVAYLEWKHSIYNVDFANRYDIGDNHGQGLICQECHMPHSAEGGVYIARWTPPKAEPKDHFSQHYFVGGNVFMLNVLQKNINDLDLTASTEKFEDTKERTMHQLQHATARLSVINLRHRGDELTGVLQVDNLAGHKFPTGIPSRRSWIHLKVTDVSGQVLFESGKPLNDGRIEGNAADTDITSYEPHYEEITQPDQVQIYEGVMRDTDNEVTYTLLRAANFAKDNRLLPKGFDKTTASADISVAGRALADANFIGGSDQVVYRINTAGHTGPYIMAARLLFTAVSYPFVKDLAKDQELTEVNRFMQYYRNVDKLPQEIAAVQATVR